MDLYRAAFESSPEILMCLDEKGAILRVNRKTESALGYTREELIGQSVGTLLPEILPFPVLGPVFPDAGAAPDGAIPVQARRKDGSRIPMEAVLNSAETRSGPVVIAALRDTTEKLEAERSRKALLDRLELSAEAAGMGYWTYDDVTGRFWCDSRCAQLLGGAPEDFPDVESVLERMLPEDREKRWHAVLESLESHGRYASEVRVVLPGGGLHWVGDVGRCVGGGAGTRALAGVAFDISERKAAEEQALAARRRERELFETAPDGIFTADRDGIYYDVNASGCRLLGRDREDIVGRSLADFVAPEERAGLLEMRIRMQDGEVHVAEWNLGHKDGHFVPAEISARIFPDGRWQEFARDISERKEAERKQAQLVRDLRASLDEVKVLKGLLPICVHCKRIRDDEGEWENLETYIRQRTEAQFSHGICPTCMEKHYPEYAFQSGP